MITNGLVLYLPLYSTDLQGSPITSKDASVLSCTVTGAIWGNQGRTFNGTSDDISLGNPTTITSTTQGTIIYWVKPTNLEGIHTQIGFGGDNVTQPGKFSCEFRQVAFVYHLTVSHQSEGSATVDIIRGDTAIPIDNWYFCAIISNGTAYSLYVNNISQNLTTTQGSNQGNWFSDANPTTPALFIGRLRYDGTNIQHYEGIIGEVWIYNRVLTEAEIASIYNETVKTYKACWDFFSWK